MKINPKICNLTGIVLSLISLVILLNISSRRPAGKALERSNQAAGNVPADEKKQQLQQDYSVLAGKYLFHPQRGAKIKKKIKRQTAPRSIRQLHFELKGVYRSDNAYGALIQVGGIRTGLNNSDKELQPADSAFYYVNNEIADGYRLTKVNSNSVIITRNSEKIEVLLPKLMPPENDAGKK